MENRHQLFHSLYSQEVGPDPRSFPGRFDQVLTDPALGDEVQYREKQKRPALRLTLPSRETQRNANTLRLFHHLIYV